METDPQSNRLRETVTAGARLLARLEGVLRRVEAGGHGAAFELAMSYGRALQNVIVANSGRARPSGPSAAHEAILGRVAFRGWQNTHTRVDERADLARMVGHWGKIVVLVLGGLAKKGRAGEGAATTSRALLSQPRWAR